MPSDAESRDARGLMPLVYDELRGVAERFLRRQPAGFTLRPTELVHEACLHLMQHGHADWTSTGHFRAIATHKLWQIVVDQIRRRCAAKRGGALARDVAEPQAGTAPPPPAAPRRHVSPEQVTVEWRDRDVDLLDLADALAGLADESRRLHDVVMLHWFGGLTHAEVAAHLGVSPSTAEKDFRYALAWLRRRMESETPHRD
ncbi:MAG: sigma-70 family RNA polymerase sigma factor [Phycisphaerales bacterium]|nr:sigma-70 family RNA polymerase sigma factor [Phycisphaerales bacterium]